MTHENEQDSNQTTQPTEDDFSTKFNQAFSAREKRLMAAFEKKLSEFASSLTKPAPTETVEATEGKSEASELEKLKREIREMKKRERDAIESARREKASTRISQALKGKVLDDWSDVAVERLSSKIKFEGDEPVITLNDLSYSLDEAVSEWLKQPENKRFIPAPKATPRAAPAIQPVPVVGNGQQQLSYEEKLALAAMDPDLAGLL